MIVKLVPCGAWLDRMNTTSKRENGKAEKQKGENQKTENGKDRAGKVQRIPENRKIVRISVLGKKRSKIHGKLLLLFSQKSSNFNFVSDKPLTQLTTYIIVIITNKFIGSKNVNLFLKPF